jgi:hypothetical protein
MYQNNNKAMKHKDNEDSDSRKDFRRENIKKKKILDKSDQDSFDIKSKKNSEIKKRKEEIDEEEWKDWERFYNR